MYTKPMLSLDQCLAAINAMVADFNKDPNRRPVDMSIVDDAGNLLAYARMDRCMRPSFRSEESIHRCHQENGLRGLCRVAQQPEHDHREHR